MILFLSILFILLFFLDRTVDLEVKSLELTTSEQLEEEEVCRLALTLQK